jgi:anti-sigma regulatory factor (Ser/Thr protein kinase)
VSASVAARAELSGPLADWWLRRPAGGQLLLPRDPASVRVARRLVRDVCSVMRWPSTGEVAELLVSELVGNVVRHARSARFWLMVQATDTGLRVRVIDADPHAPTPREVRPDSPDGYGLRIVSELSKAWGITLEPQRKIVWFVLPGQA